MANSSLSLSPEGFSSLKGEIRLEKSKSIANRVLVLQALSENSFSIDDPGSSDDVNAMLSALSSQKTKVNCGLAGTVMRFLSATFSILPGERILDGEQSLRRRPIKPLIEALISLGADISYLENEGFLPIRINGKGLEGGNIRLDQSISSQFSTALMLIGPYLKKGLIIRRNKPGRSESYIELTMEVMKDLGYELSIDDYDICIHPSKAKKQFYKIEADWSSAVYWMAFVCLIPDSEVILNGLFENSKQADHKLLSVLSAFGLEYTWVNSKLYLRNSGLKTDFFECDCSLFPDQAQTLAFLCASMGIECKLSGLETLVFKETNRIKALESELTKMGLTCKSGDSQLVISGDISGDHFEINTYEDHRMAMSAALLGVNYNVTIRDHGVVSKSYPRFWEDLKLLTTSS